MAVQSTRSAIFNASLLVHCSFSVVLLSLLLPGKVRGRRVLCFTLRRLTLKAPITTAADDIHDYFFIVFQRFLRKIKVKK